MPLEEDVCVCEREQRDAGEATRLEAAEPPPHAPLEHLLPGRASNPLRALHGSSDPRLARQRGQDLLPVFGHLNAQLLLRLTDSYSAESKIYRNLIYLNFLNKYL